MGVDRATQEEEGEEGPGEETSKGPAVEGEQKKEPETARQTLGEEGEARRTAASPRAAEAGGGLKSGNHCCAQGRDRSSHTVGAW